VDLHWVVSMQPNDDSTLHVCRYSNKGSGVSMVNRELVSEMKFLLGNIAF